MADLKRTLEIIFEGNDQASRKASEVIDKMRELEAAGKDVDGAFKTLGIDPKKVIPTADILRAFDTIATASNASGAQILSGLQASITGITRNGGSLDGLRTSIDAAFRAGKLSATEYELAAKRIDDAHVKAAGSASQLNGALRALAAGLVFKAFVDANVEVEKFDRGIKAVKGSTADTGAELAYLRGLAERFGVEVGSLTRSYTSLTAATVGTNLEGRATREVFEAVTRAMAATGRSSADTEGALRAVEQIASKGKVQMEELRGQLGDRLPGAAQIAARALGVTTAELEDLLKSGVSAADFLPKFADELNRTFAGASFEGYTASLSRLRNSVDELLVAIGQTGAFDALTTLVKFAGTEIRAFGIDLGQVGNIYQAAARAIRQGDFSAFGDEVREAARKAQQLYDSLNFGEQTLAETERLLKRFPAPLEEIGTQAKLRTIDLQAMTRASSELDDLLKRLGVNPKRFSEGIDQIARDLEALSRNPAATGEKFLAGFEAALKRVRTDGDINAIGAELTRAFTSGKLTADEFTIGVNDLAKAQARVDKATGDAAKKIKDQAKALQESERAAEKAQERAERFRLEMEKLASNERIKAIEAKVQLNVADIQAQTERVKAILSSIDNTVNSTGSLLKDLFGSLTNGFIDPSARRLVEEQIAAENKRRQDALDIQRKISQAQIDYLNAQTKAIARGDAMIKIDGAGLQPHLEAFMFEILKKIQTRVNNDGLKFLLGV